MSGLEALGAVSAIFQTISFAHEVFSLCYDFYDDKPVAFDKLNRYAEDMEKATLSIQQHVTQLQSLASAADEKQLRDVLQRTGQNAAALRNEVAYVLEKRQAGSITKAFRTHFRYIKKKSTIAALKSTLEDCDRTAKALLANFSIKQSDLILFQQSIGFLDLSDHVQNVVQRLIDQQFQAAIVAEENHKTLCTDIAGLSLDIEKSYAKTRGHMDENFARYAEAESTGAAYQQLLESLEFPDMWQRQNQIVDPGEASFEDSFFRHESESGLDEDTDPDTPTEYGHRYTMAWTSRKQAKGAVQDLRTWIDTGTTPFWIGGRAGSGKSTLVKFLADQEREHSERHPELKKEILVHYFWRAGSDMQQSKKGCFCSLMHQMLQNSPQRSGELFMESSRVSWKKQVSDWSISELQKGLQQLIAKSSTTIIIFIDGLDEMTEDGDLYDVLEMLKWQDKLLNCRFCVSSRPEFVIQKHLSGHPTIRVQELTYGTMMSYTTRKLSEAIRKRDWNEYLFKSLLSQVVEKADGIFLWLVLVTDILRRSIWQGKDYDEVLKRLDGLPTKLEALFTDMWDRMGVDFASDQTLAASYINAVVAYRHLAQATQPIAQEGLPLVPTPSLLSTLFMVDLEGAQRLFSAQRKVKEQDQLDWLEAKQDEMTTCCMGLLVCDPQESETAQKVNDDELSLYLFTSQRVLFVHRSAFDFFTKTKAGQLICSRSNSTYLDCCLSIAKAVMLEWPFVPENGPHPYWSFTYGQALFAVTGLSEAVTLDYSTFALAKDLLYDALGRLYQFTQKYKHLLAVIAGREHVLDMLASPSIASTEIGRFFFTTYWTGLESLMYLEKVPKLPPPQVLVAKMLQGGANPPQTMPIGTHSEGGPNGNSAFNSFLLYTWCCLVNRLDPSYCHEMAQDFRSLDGCWEALNSFLGTNPRLNATIRLGIWMTKCRRVVVHTDGEIRMFPCPRQTAPGDSFDEDFDWPVGLVVFSLDSGWLCKHILASWRKIQELGQVRGAGLSFLQQIEKRLSELEARQGYQETAWTLSHLFLYERVECTLFWRSQFDEASAACAAEFILRQLEKNIVDRHWRDHGQISRALLTLMWVDDFTSCLVFEDGQPLMNELPCPKMHQWPQRSDNAHTVEWGSDVDSLRFPGLELVLVEPLRDGNSYHVSVRVQSGYGEIFSL